MDETNTALSVHPRITAPSIPNMGSSIPNMVVSSAAALQYAVALRRREHFIHG